MTAPMRLIYRRINQPATPYSTRCPSQPASGTTGAQPAARSVNNTSTSGLNQPATPADAGQHIAYDDAATSIGSELGHHILCALFGDADVQIWLDTSGNTGSSHTQAGITTGSSTSTSGTTSGTTTGSSTSTSGNTGSSHTQAGITTGSSTSTSGTTSGTADTLNSATDNTNTGGHISIITGSGGPLSRTYYHTATAQSPHHNIFAELKEGLDGGVEVEDGWPHPFALGWVGALGYEARHHANGQPSAHATSGAPGAHTSHLPSAAMLYADRAAVIDHTGAVYVAALIPNPGAATCSDRTDERTRADEHTRVAERTRATQIAWLDEAASTIAQLIATGDKAVYNDGDRAGAAHHAGTAHHTRPVTAALTDRGTHSGDHAGTAHYAGAAHHARPVTDVLTDALTDRGTHSGDRADAALNAAEFVFDQSREEYLRSIAACKDFIAAGDSYEVCLTTTATGPALRDIVATPVTGLNHAPQSGLATMTKPERIEDPEMAAYLRLRATSPVPYGAYLRFRRVGKEALGFTILSASPERFLRVSQEGVVSAKPIKGTRARAHVLACDNSAQPRNAAEPLGTQPTHEQPRHATQPPGTQPPGTQPTHEQPRNAAQPPRTQPTHAEHSEAIDRAITRELASNPKDRAENLMIVDLLRNDLGQVCVPGTVRVPKIFDVETYSHVHQLVSTIEGQLADGLSAVDVLAASFPGGSMTGAPKIRTMQIIDQLERQARGFYSGTIGWLSPNGAADLSITIRTLVDDGRSCSFGVGGAIVADSDPEAEYQEILTKASALLDALGARLRDSPSTA